MIERFHGLVIALLLAADTHAEPRPPLTEVSTYEGRPIHEVVVRPPPASDNQMQRSLSKEGEEMVRREFARLASKPFNIQLVEQALTRVNRIGRFRRMQTRVQMLDDGTLVLLIEAEEVPVLKEITITGNLEISGSELQAECPTGVLVGTPYDASVFDRLVRRIKERYLSEGFLLVQVEHRVEVNGMSVAAQIHIREGTRVLISQVELPELPPELFSAAHSLMRWHGCEAGKPFVESSFDEAKERLAALFRDAGYLDVRVDGVLQPDATGTTGAISLFFDLAAKYTGGKVAVQWSKGSEGLDTSAIDREFAGRIDGVPYTDELRVRVVHDLRSRLWAHGYAKAQIGLRELRRTDTPVVDVLLGVNPGVRFRLGNIRIIGNRMAHSSQVLAMNRELPLRRQHADSAPKTMLVPGELLDWGKVEQLEYLLSSSAWCGNARFRIDRGVGDGPEQVADLVIEIEEVPYVVDVLRNRKLAQRTGMGDRRAFTDQSPSLNTVHGRLLPAQIDWERLYASPDSVVIPDEFKSAAIDRDARKFGVLLEARQSAPGNQEPLSVLLRGDAELLGGSWYEAISHYEDLIKRFPDDPTAFATAERYVALAETFRLASDVPMRNAGGDEDATAAELLIRVQERFPGTDVAERAARSLVGHYTKVKDVEAATDATKNFLAISRSGASRLQVAKDLLELINSLEIRGGQDLSSAREAIQIVASFSTMGTDLPVEGAVKLQAKLLVAEVEYAWIFMRSLVLPERELRRARELVLRRLVRDHPRIATAPTIAQLLADPASLISLPAYPASELLQVLVPE